jgi:hypothetical protein
LFGKSHHSLFYGARRDSAFFLILDQKAVNAAQTAISIMEGGIPKRNAVHGGPITMTICSCGNTAAENSDRCARCNAFKALELKSDATSAEIHNAHEVLSKAWNPGRFEDDAKLKAGADERLAAIDAAYSLLTRGSVQTAPFRSRAAGRRVEAPLVVAVDEHAPESAPGRRKPPADAPAAKRIRVPLPLLIGCGALVAGVVIVSLLFKPLDSVLMGLPVAGNIYAQYKTGIRSELQEMKNKLGLGVGSAMPAPSEQATTASPPTQEIGKNAESSVRAATQPKSPGRITASAGATSRPGQERGQQAALPFITAGLTRDEVIAAEGAPTAEVAGEMDYGNSRLFFDKGVVYGWRIDPSSPLRVKLWPDAMVDANLQAFGMDSTKNEVIAVQGTPTTYSPSMFGYGKSEVYFQYGRVVGWKSDNATPLRTTSR